MEKMIERLSHEDFVWIAERVHGYRTVIAEHPGWSSRLLDAIGILIWSASVDGRDGGAIRKDGWVPAGKSLRDVHFKNVPFSEMARRSLERGELTSIKREHVVPRDKVREIVLQTAHIDDTARVLKEYALVALVHETETSRLKPSSKMPQGWDARIDWTHSPLPRELPSPWARYASAKPEPLVLRYYDGRPVF